MMRAGALVLVLAAADAGAGHGFMNAFADVEWLPDPGTRPGELLYRLEQLGESAELALAAPGDETLALALAFAKEKLAEASAALAAGERDHARQALARYRVHLETAAAQIAAGPAPGTAGRRQRYLDALLEHVYIMSIDYLDQPLGIRTALMPMFETAMGLYEQHAAALPRAAKEAMFFKEEEIRWSVEMARQADAQGITN